MRKITEVNLKLNDVFVPGSNIYRNAMKRPVSHEVENYTAQDSTTCQVAKELRSPSLEDPPAQETVLIEHSIIHPSHQLPADSSPLCQFWSLSVCQISETILIVKSTIKMQLQSGAPKGKECRCICSFIHSSTPDEHLLSSGCGPDVLLGATP